MTAVHVLPSHDLVAHEADAGCPCGPRAELVSGPHGDAWLYVHHSLDAREAPGGEAKTP